MIRRIAAALVVVAALIGAAVMSASGGGEQGKTIKIAFDNAFGLTPGGDLKVGGVKAGKTTSFDVSRGPECQLGHSGQAPPRACAIVTGDISVSGLQSFRTDASCAIRQESLIGEYYVDCQPGNARQELGKHQIIPDTRTESTIPSDLVQNISRRPYRERLQLIIAELGTGLAGRPQDIAQLLRRAHPGLRETDQVLRILANQHQIIQNFITNANTVVAQLDQRKRDVANWIVQAGRTAQVSATRQRAIAQGWHDLPTFLAELKSTMFRLGQFIDQQNPLLHDLQRAAPSLTTFFKLLGPFSQSSRPNFRSLGHAAVIGTRAFRDFTPDLEILDRLSRDAPATAKPLRQLLQTLDDRHRAIDSNPGAAPLAPPPPDPTSMQEAPGKGYTGMEALLSYFYFQTLSLNEFDSVSHFLRVVTIVDSTCGAYQTNPDAATQARCGRYLGPFQPGVTSPDPTQHGPVHFASANSSRPGPRTAGQAPAPPIPGRPDYSHPNPTLPPSLQQLLQSLGNLTSPSHTSLPNLGRLPQLPSSSPAPVNPALNGNTVQQAMNFLLGP